MCHKGESPSHRSSSLIFSAPTELVKVRKGSGFHNLMFLPSSGARTLCSFRDGAVGVYDFDKRRWEYLTEPGHTETIFDVQFKPSNPDILGK